MAAPISAATAARIAAPASSAIHELAPNSSFAWRAASPPSGCAVPVTCTIIAFNEVDRIGRTIESVRGLVDEVIVVDSGSTDGTQDLARALGARVVEREWAGYGPQKRFAEDEARNDWILNLDADEWLSDELRQELRGLLSHPPKASSYRIRVTLVYPHRDTPALFANSTMCLRLYDKRITRFSESTVFDNVPEQRDTEMLRGRVWHKSFRSLADVMRKELRYFELQAGEVRKSRLKLAIRLPIEFPWQFFRYYVLDRHMFGGLYGFAAASVIAHMRFMRLVILRGW